eukprot:1142491-Pelagomonas_calceolata.AAC.2
MLIAEKKPGWQYVSLQAGCDFLPGQCADAELKEEHAGPKRGTAGGIRVVGIGSGDPTQNYTCPNQNS